MRKTFAVLAVVLATSLPSCVCFTEYMQHRTNDLADIVQPHVGFGSGGGVKLEVTPLVHLGYYDSGHATALGWTMPVPGERIYGTWEEHVQALGFVLGGRETYTDDLTGREFDTVYGDYGAMHNLPSNPLHWLFVRGTIGAFGHLDVQVSPGEAIDFILGVFTFDPGGDDAMRYYP